MPAPIVAAASKWAAAKLVKKGTENGVGGKLAISGGSIALIGILVLSLILSLIGAVMAVMGAMAALNAGAAGAAAANECATADAVDADPSGEALADIPPIALEAYQKAGTASGVNWTFIAAIGKIESDHGRFGGRSINPKTGVVGPTPIQGPPTRYGRAVGPMQFLTSTWASVGRDGNADGKKDPQNIWDAAMGTGFYLKVSGAPKNMYKAIFAYNHADWYVQKILAQAKKYEGAAAAAPSVGRGDIDVRIVQANIKVSLPNSSFAADVRKVAAYDPDFITYNEVHRRSAASLSPPGYRTWHPLNRSESIYTGDTALTWDARKWTIQDKGLTTLHVSGVKGGKRYATWGTFKSKSGHQLSVISVHEIQYVKTPERIALFTRGMGVLKDLTRRLDNAGPVLMAGDFNVHYPRRPSTAPSWHAIKQLKQVGLTSTHEVFGPKVTGTGGGVIDYVFFQRGNGMKAKRHSTFPMISDHNGLVADFEFAGKGGRPGTTVLSAAQVAARADLARAAGIAAAAKNSAWTQPMKPGTFRLTARYGQRGPYWSKGYHTGLDYAAPVGTPIFAAGPGRVITRGDQSWAGPNFVQVDHGMVGGKRIMTWYAHMSAKVVKNGQMVQAGDPIGRVGALGNVTGPHLHFEVNSNGRDVDPTLFLAGAGAPTGDIPVLAGGDLGDCGGPTGSAGIVNGNGAWGGYKNGQIPLSAMCKLSFYPTYLECNAAKALEELNKAYTKQFRTSVGPVGGYRSYAAQVICRQQKGNLCATPGTSNHGWGLAVDLAGGGINNFGTPQHNWMAKKAAAYGWVLPSWAQRTGSKPEPWHWEFTGTGATNMGIGGSSGSSRIFAKQVRRTSTSFTVSSFNMLGSSHTEGCGNRCDRPGWPHSTSRMKRSLDLLDDYNVSVVGGQEVQRPMRSVWNRRSGWDTYSDPNRVDNPIGWRTDEWRLVAGGTFNVPYFGGKLKPMPIVRLKNRESGAEILFMNVHNPADVKGPARRWRDQAVTIEGNLARQATSANLPVLLLGDMNDRNNFYCNIARYGMRASAGGSYSNGSCRPPRTGIDWITGNEKVRFQSHRYDKSPQRQKFSDHPAVISRVRVMS